MNVREWALPVYTILLQLAVGALLMLWIIRAVIIFRLGYNKAEEIVKVPVLIIFFTIILAMIGAHFHLSRPFQSLSAVLNFRRSWLSREIVFTVLFFLNTGCLLLIHWFVPDRVRLKGIMGWTAILFGSTAVYCMSHIYLLPSQAAWNSPVTVVSFYVTMLFLGFTATPTMLLIELAFSKEWGIEKTDWRSEIVRRVLLWSTGAAFVSWLVVVLINLYQINLLRAGDEWAQMSFELLVTLYQPLLAMRLGLPVIGVVWLLISLFRIIRNSSPIKDLMVPVYISCISVLVGEILGRFLFYATHIRIGV